MHTQDQPKLYAAFKTFEKPNTMPFNMLFQGVGLSEILGNVMRIKIRNICSIHLFLPDSEDSQNLWRAVAEKILQWNTRWSGSAPLWGWGLWEGQKIIDDRGTDFFLSLLSHSSDFLGLELGAQMSITFSMKYCHWEHSMRPLDTFRRSQACHDSPYYPEKCNILVGPKSWPLGISLFLMPILTRVLLTFPSLLPRSVELQKIIPLGTLEN